MALFKISKGSKSNLPTTLTEGYCWYTFEDSKFYIDFKDENGVLTRKALSAENAETLMGISLDELKNEIATQDIVILREAQAYTDTALETATTQDAVVLHEAQTYTDAALAKISDKISTISLPASGWTAATNVYSQVVAVSGATANSKVDIYPTPEQLVELQSAGIALVAVNEDGVVTVYAINNKPTADYAVQVTLTEVNEGG